MTTIKIVSGHSCPGGSTVANIALCNLLNDNGLDAIFYGPHEWHMGQCRADRTCNLEIRHDDLLIVHYLLMPERPVGCRRVVLSCHETSLYPVRSIPCFWDVIHYVSDAQCTWQGVGGTVIPNRVTGLEYRPTHTGIAGVIGGVSPGKRTHVSIQRALDDGFRTVYVYGEVIDKPYYNQHIHKYVETGCVTIKGFVNDKQKIYDSVEAVYHSSASETFNLVRAECAATGTAYHGNAAADPDVTLYSDDRLVAEWKKLLGIA